MNNEKVLPSSHLEALSPISATWSGVNISNTMSNHIPPLKSLMAFDAAARLGSFSRAADELSLTQSAISQQLVKLEETLGQKLFLRRGKGVTLTAAGALLHETVRETLQRLSAGLDRIAPYKNPDSVLVACPEDVAHGWLLPRLPRFRAAFPAAEIWVIAREEIIEIDRVDVDLVISRRPIHSSGVESVPLLEDNGIAVAGPAVFARLRNLAYPQVLEKAPILSLESEPDWAGRLREPALKHLRLQRAATLDDARLLLAAAERDMGIAFISRVLAADALAQGRVSVLTQIPSQLRTRLWLMRARLQPRTPLADPVFQWLREEAAKR